MEGQIEHLTIIQQIDTQIREIVRQKEVYPKKIDELKSVLMKEKNDLESLKNFFEESNKERRTLQGEIDLENDRIERIDAKLPQIKTNKEYQALCKEIDNMRKVIMKHEERMLELMEEEEKLKAEIEAKASVFEKEQSDINVRIRDYETEMSKFDDRITRFNHEKKIHEQNVDKEYLTAYERIKARRDGIAIVAVIKGVCQGCFMNIPPQLFILVQKSDDLQTCPNCNRILYWKED